MKKTREELQEKEYNFPYHYLDIYSPIYRVLGFERVLLLEFVAELCLKQKPHSLLDVGCGDGRFLYEMRKRNIKCEGVDVSKRAINFAKAFNPENTFYIENIITSRVKKKYDLITCLEVIEHLPPEELPQFILSLKKRLTKKGKIIITVPTTNIPVAKKHYQHFTDEKIRKYVNDSFEIEEIRFFWKQKPVLRKLIRLIGVSTYIFCHSCFRKVWPSFERFAKRRFLPATKRNGKQLLVVLKQ